MNRIVKRYRIWLIMLVAPVLLIAGCRSAKTIAEKDKASTVDSKTGVISILEQKTHMFQTLKARKVDLTFNMNGVGERVQGKIAIYRDSIMAVSIIPALGYEIMRILCTEDSVIIINRPDKSYSASSFEYFKKKYKIPVGFLDLQAILANEVFYYKEDCADRIFEKKLYKQEQNHLFVIDAFREDRRITNQGIEIDTKGRKLENIFIVDYESKMRFDLDYNEFEGIGDVLFPKEILINLVEGNNTIKMELRYGQVIVDDSLNIDFSVPVSYRRVDI